MAVFFAGLAARGDPGPAEGPRSFLDSLASIARGLNKLGEKAEDMLGPKIGPLWDLEGDKAAGAVSQTRQVTQNCPVRPGAVVSITNEFGEIRVESWNNQVVQIQADVAAEAESADLALRVAQDTQVVVIAAEDHVDVRTQFPDTRGKGYVRNEVNYVIKVPSDANVLCDNDFGDTIIQGVGGTLGLNSRFGHVDLRDMSGLVSVRASGGGEFTFQANNLQQGGVFELSGAEAEFSRIAGTLKVSSNMGSVVLRDIAPEARVDVTSESGPIRFYISENAAPDLTASALFGNIRSAIDMTQTPQGKLTLARSPNVESKQQVSLHASFGDIHILRAGAETPADSSLQTAGAVARGTEVVDGGVLERVAHLREGKPVVVDAIRGDIRIEGTDGDSLSIRASRSIRLVSEDGGSTTAKARAAIEALALTVDETEDNRLVVRSAVRDDMASLGCTYYRVDLVILCPRTSPLKVYGTGGLTSVSGIAAATVVEQDEGRVAVQDCKEALELTNHSGDVEVTNCAGPATISAKRGTVATHSVRGKQMISCVDGKTLIEAPQGEVVVRHHGGDVRILALDAVLGAYDVRVEQGNLSIAVPTTADATFDVTAENGNVYPSVVELTGSVSKELCRYRGRLNNGQFTVALSAKDGNIVID